MPLWLLKKPIVECVKYLPWNEFSEPHGMIKLINKLQTASKKAYKTRQNWWQNCKSTKRAYTRDVSWLLWSPKNLHCIVSPLCNNLRQIDKKGCLRCRTKVKNWIGAAVLGVSLLSILWMDMIFFAAIGHWKTTAPCAAGAGSSSFLLSFREFWYL